jgi:hypothetical protein
MYLNINSSFQFEISRPLMQSVDNCLDAEPFKLVNYSQWVLSSVGPRWVPRKLLICQIGVILEGSGGLHTIDTTGLVAYGKFCSHTAASRVAVK